MSEMTREEALELVRSDKAALKNLPAKFKKDREIVLEAIKINAGYIECVDDALRNDKEIILATVKSWGSALQFASDRLKKDKDVVLAAVNADGCALIFADNTFSNHKEIVLAALKQCKKQKINLYDEYLRNGERLPCPEDEWDMYLDFVLEFIDKPLWQDITFVIAAVKSHKEAYQFVDEKIQFNQKVIDQLDL